MPTATDDLHLHSTHILRLEDIAERTTQRLDLALNMIAGLKDGQDRIETRLDGVDGRLDGIDGRLDAVEGRLGAVEGRLGTVEGKLDQVIDLLTARPPASN